MRVFRDLWWFFVQEKKSYIIGIIFLIVASSFSLVPPYVVGVIVDHIEQKSLTVNTLLVWVGLILASGVIHYGSNFIWRSMLFGSAIKLGRQLRNQLYEHFTNMSPGFFQKRRTGDLMAHATNDVQAVEGTAGEGVLTLVDSVVMGSLVVIVMFFFSWELTLITLMPMPLMAWATSRYGTLLHERFHKAQAAFSELNDKVQENVAGMRVVKAFGIEEAEKAKFRKQSADVVDKNMAVARIDALFDPTISFIVGISYFLAIFFGAVFVVRNTMTLGELTSFTIYLGLLIWPMLALGFLFNIVERGRASYDRISRLLKIKPDIVNREGAVDERPQGEIAFHIQTFAYPEQETPALQNVHFSLQPGETVGLVGKTGSGKTTVLKLLLREFDCENGDIAIGGRSIYDYTLDALRRSIGYVPQDHFLFSATIAENIAFANPDASQGEIERVARLAHIHEDILGFQDGYDTIVGERGVTLSGGQKQRISIARALLADPDILILDDSLSAVDAKTEEAILRSLKQTRQNKTTIIAAHRLSAVQHANLILVLDQGRIVERGTHDHLMNNEGWYASVYRSQQLEALVAKGGMTS